MVHKRATGYMLYRNIYFHFNIKFPSSWICVLHGIQAYRVSFSTRSILVVGFVFFIAYMHTKTSTFLSGGNKNDFFRAYEKSY